MKKIPRILLTPGEPAGVGPDIVVKAAQLAWPAELIVVGDPELLLSSAARLHLPLALEEFDSNHITQEHKPGVLKIIPIALASQNLPGQLNLDNAQYVIQTLEVATDYCLQKKADALVTGPVHKGIINDAGIAFTGHTEFDYYT